MDPVPIELEPAAVDELRHFFGQHPALYALESREARLDPVVDPNGYFWHELHEPQHRAIARSVTWPALQRPIQEAVPAHVPLAAGKAWEVEELHEPSSRRLEIYPMEAVEAERVLQQLSEKDRDTFQRFRDFAHSVPSTRTAARQAAIEAVDREVSYLTTLRRQIVQGTEL